MRQRVVLWVNFGLVMLWMLSILEGWNKAYYIISGILITEYLFSLWIILRTRQVS